MVSYYLGALAFLLFIIVLKVVRSVANAYHRNRYMPPGPSGLPFLGNIFQVGDQQWVRFAEWKERYGPIFSLNFAGQAVVVINDFKTAAEIFDKRAGVYSSRPRFIMANDIMCGGMAFPLMSNNDLWRRMRRAAHEGFGGHSLSTYQLMHERESALLALRMLQNPENWHMDIWRSTSAVMVSAVYGWPLTDTSSDSVVKDIMDISHRVSTACLPGKYMVDILPFMMHLPGWMARWKISGQTSFAKDTKLLVGLLNDVIKDMQSTTAVPCFATTLLNDNTSGLTPEAIAWLAGIMFIAGAETTAATLTAFMLAMVLHPEAIRSAQAQIDAVVGHDRLPTVNDRDNLPYIAAVVREVLRWSPVTPLAIPKRSTKDDWYKGHFIPADSLVILNVWAANRDTTYFSNPEEFRPERYLSPSGELSEAIPNTHGQGHLSFGSGKRICLGKDFANQALFMNVVFLLWAFDIRPAEDADGQPILPSRDDLVDDGLVV
ncbi:hypothetical protein EIP86_001502 [Pleurotus ostreatoroseus]|nr:hypothetical protein EIP86_001502 [Pleurotus ostreatoroseus]